MAVTVKAFLELDGQMDGQIRRFPLPEADTTEFTYLHEKIAELFDGLQNTKFSLYWKGRIKFDPIIDSNNLGLTFYF